MAAGDKYFRTYTENSAGGYDVNEIEQLSTAAIADGSVTTAKLANLAVTNAKLANGALSGNLVAALANDQTSPSVEALFATAIADASGNEDIVLVLPVGTTWAITDGVVEQAGIGDVGNTYTFQKGASAISNAIGGSATDGARLFLGSIAAANKANNSFANGDTLRVAVSKAGGTAAGVAYTRMRRLT